MVRSIENGDTGLKTLHIPLERSGIDLDIIAIHGIGAHPDDTWCKNVAPNNSRSQFVNWLSDARMLPRVVPKAQIMRYGYESEWFGERMVHQNLTNVAKRFLEELKRDRNRKYLSTRPRLIIAHCFGGLVAVKAFLLANRDHDDYPGIYDSIIGIIFLATPFRGAEQFGQKALIKAAQEKHGNNVNPKLLSTTQPSNDSIFDLVEEFERLRKKFEGKPRVTCFFEAVESDVMKIVGQEGQMALRVPRESASLGGGATTLGLARNHFEMNKFGDPSENDFKTVGDAILGMVQSQELTANPESQLEQGYRHYKQFTRRINKELWPPDKLPRAIGCFEEAITRSKNSSPQYTNGIIKANIYLARCYREQSYMKGDNSAKLNEIDKSDNCLYEAHRLAMDRQFEHFLERVETEQLLTAARKTLIRAKSGNIMARKQLKDIEEKLVDAQAALTDLDYKDEVHKWIRYVKNEQVEMPSFFSTIFKKGGGRPAK